MRIIFSLFILFYFLPSCRNIDSNNPVNKYITWKIRNKALKVAVNHIQAQSDVTTKKVLENGAMVYSGTETDYLVDTTFIMVGKINDDKSPDAIVTLFIFRDMILTGKEHLILINNRKGKLIIGKVLNGDMKFLSIDDGIISIETSKVDPDSPFYGCEECKEVHKYLFKGGVLQIIE